MRPPLAWVLALAIGLAARPAPAVPCGEDDDCAAGERCIGLAACGSGVCAPAFALDRFPIGVSGVTPYTAEMISALDHSGAFYTQCCDTEIIAFTGETARREDGASLCPAPPEFPACFFTPNCICGYAHPAGGSYAVNGNYVGAVFGAGELSYDGHAGYDYRYAEGTPLVALADGTLCKAEEDLINGHVGAPSAWDKFHTFYVDHGVIDGVGYAAWYLHGTDLEGAALQALTPGQCAPVVRDQQVATVGNTGTFLPHLHFEVRTYVPAEGPEGPGNRVIDPYGWRGSAPDPWSDPLENPQATTQLEPLWVACGNGRVECGEQCDDANQEDGDSPAARALNDCCSASCQYEPAGTPCDADASPCTADACDSGGTCVAPPPLECGVCERCDAALGCVPDVATGCAAAPRSQLVLRDRPGGNDQLRWRWRQGTVSAGGFGDPTAGDGYTACLFATSASDPTPLFGVRVPPGGTCGARPCWQSRGTPERYIYRNRTDSAGIDTLVLRPGEAGSAAILLRSRGAQEPLATPPLDPPILMQLRADGGQCWEASFDAGALRANRAGLLKAQVD